MSICIQQILGDYFELNPSKICKKRVSNRLNREEKAIRDPVPAGFISLLLGIFYANLNFCYLFICKLLQKKVNRFELKGLIKVCLYSHIHSELNINSLTQSQPLILFNNHFFIFINNLSSLDKLPPWLHLPG